MSIYLKNLIKVSNKVEYVVVSFYKDKTKPVSYSQDSEMTLTKYIALLTNSNIRYTDVKQFKILKTKPSIKENHYESIAFDFYVMPVVKIEFNEDYFDSNKALTYYRSRDRIANINILKYLHKYYPELEVCCTFTKDIRSYDLCCYNIMSLRNYPSMSRYAVLGSMPACYLNPNGKSAMQFAGKLNAFETVWRELINRKLKPFGFEFSGTAATPNINDGLANVKLINDTDNSNLNAVMNSIRDEIHKELDKKIKDKLSDFFKTLEECHIDKTLIFNEILQHLIRNDIRLGFDIFETTIDLKELTK